MNCYINIFLFSFGVNIFFLSIFSRMIGRIVHTSKHMLNVQCKAKFCFHILCAWDKIEIYFISGPTTGDSSCREKV